MTAFYFYRNRMRMNPSNLLAGFIILSHSVDFFVNFDSAIARAGTIRTELGNLGGLLVLSLSSNNFFGKSKKTVEQNDFDRKYFMDESRQRRGRDSSINCFLSKSSAMFDNVQSCWRYSPLS